MDQQTNIREQIAKQEQRNVYLSQLLKDLEDKFIKIKNNKQKEIVMTNRADIQIAQMKNIDKRIEIYRHELEKLKTINTDSVVAELKKLRSEIMTKQKMFDDSKKQLNTLQDAVNKFRAKNMGKQKNIEMQKLYGQRKYEMRILHKKLKALENEEYTQNVKPLPKRSARSFTQIIKEKDVSQISKVEEDKKGKIDKYAMYKNLIRFYTLQEEKLKKQLESLSKEVEANKSINENIKFYQQKVATLIQKK